MVWNIWILEIWPTLQKKGGIINNHEKFLHSAEISWFFRHYSREIKGSANFTIFNSWKALVAALDEPLELN